MAKQYPLTPAQAEDLLARKARTDPAFFMFYLTEKKPAPHHLRWFELFLNLDHKRLLLIAPRESAKTTVAAYYLAWWIGHHPLSTNLIASVSSKQAVDRLSMIREIVLSPRYQRVFPEIFIDKSESNNASEFSVYSLRGVSGEIVDYRQWRSLKSVYGDLKNPTLFASGMTSKGFIGRRISGVALVDDPHDTQTASTIAQCDKVEKFFNENIMGAVQQQGRVVVISTRFSAYDLAGRLKERRFRNGVSVWTIDEIAALDLEGKSYWQDVWSEQRLADKRDEVGEIMWQTMYMNNPVGGASRLFTQEHLSQYLPSTLPPLYQVVVSVDLAETVGSRSDWTVVTTVARDDAKPYNVYVLDILRKKVRYDAALQLIASASDRAFADYGRLDGVLFEIPASHAQADALAELRPDIPVVKVATKGNKEQRLTAFAAKAQQKTVFFNHNNENYLAALSELLGFPKAQHDDICDSLSLPFQWSGWVRSLSAGYTPVKSPYAR